MINMKGRSISVCLFVRIPPLTNTSLFGALQLVELILCFADEIPQFIQTSADQL